MHLATTLHVDFTHHDMACWLNMQCGQLVATVVTSLNIPAI